MCIIIMVDFIVSSNIVQCIGGARFMCQIIILFPIE